VGAYIPEDVLRSVLEAANIRQFIEEYVPLKKRGQNWVGLCPFHPDKDPSFSVNEQKQIFYCFGCGQGGDVFKFLMKMQGMGFTEAVKQVAARYGITVPEKAPTPLEAKRRKEADELASLNQGAADYYHRNLLFSPEAGQARHYLEKRGLGPEIISRFKVGWAPDRWDGLVKHLETLGTAAEAAERAGLLIRKDGVRGHYDRFRNRIIFPIQDRFGRTVALGGRILGEGHPKYLNSPETPIYHKGSVLYGLFENKGAIRRAGAGYVVEGYMDLLALVEGGVEPVVASLGTAFTEGHVKQLRGLCRDWILVFDGDEAGGNAALRALPLFYALDLRAKVLTLPAEDDPDTFVRREGKEAWESCAARALPGLDFAMERGLERHGRDPEGRHKTLEEMLAILGPITDPVRKSLLSGHVAQRLGVREESLWTRLSASEPPTPRRPAMRAATEKAFENKAEAYLMGFILGHPEHADAFLDAGLEMWLEDPSLRDLWTSVLHLYSTSGRLELSSLYEQLQPAPDLSALAKRLSADIPPCEDLEAELQGLIRYCEERRKKALRHHLLEQRRTGVEEVDDKSFIKQWQQLR
jgi:DNA primase